MSVKIEVVNADVLEFGADILALKFAKRLYGVDAKAVRRLQQKGVQVQSRLPTFGLSLLVDSRDALGVNEVLFLGVEPLGRFGYQSIRRFGHSTLAILGKERPSVQHLAITLHGIGFGLDESEAFRSELAGLLDAIAANEEPPALRRISMVEADPGVATRLTDLLAQLLPSGTVNEAPSLDKPDIQSLIDARVQLGTVGDDSRQKPHVFVAMPFAEEYNDRFHYGIKGAVNAVGFLCERADLAAFTGDVITWVKDRIDSATLVVADLTSANPNVYLEVGYAWGRGVRTVLLVPQGEELKFDVRSQRCLVFRSIHDLEERLAEELTSLISGTSGATTGTKMTGTKIDRF